MTLHWVRKSHGWHTPVGWTWSTAKDKPKRWDVTIECSCGEFIGCTPDEKQMKQLREGFRNISGPRS
jgi:hypothetical protein